MKRLRSTLAAGAVIALLGGTLVLSAPSMADPPSPGVAALPDPTPENLDAYHEFQREALQQGAVGFYFDKAAGLQAVRLPADSATRTVQCSYPHVTTQSFYTTAAAEQIRATFSNRDWMGGHVEYSSAIVYDAAADQFVLSTDAPDEYVSRIRASYSDRTLRIVTANGSVTQDANNVVVLALPYS